MRDREDNTKDMPINRDYESYIEDGFSFLDAKSDDNVTDNPYENARDSRNQDSMMNRNYMNEIGSTGASDEFTATLDASAIDRKSSFKDHGEKIAAMNIDGMPWFYDEIEEELQMRRSVPNLNGRETRRVIFSSLLAALMVAGVFVVACFLFLLFCTTVWF